MGRFGIGELLLIFGIVLLLFGTKRLSSLGNDLGNALKGFRNAMRDEKADKVELPSERVIEGELKEKEKEKERSQ